MKTKSQNPTARYAGLIVTVLARMEYYALISFHGRKLIVETADLEFAAAFGQAA